MSVSYPFSAVVGQQSLKLALLLAAIDPAIGGVLVRGPRGVAKTTLARALAELTPGRFVELPLGATEERVTGTLDLSGALREGKVEFAPGLLARAHDGVLYVDEVNLLPDAIVDVLLDAAASGVNVVERDGVSHRHPARFVLVGTMNPDEGELRPQLIDRFGLAVNASATLGPQERAEIVARRLDFDRDPEAFVARHADAQRALIERCTAARSRAQSIALDADALARVSERCFAAAVEGVRADLAMLRAARAHAAWHGRTRIEEADIAAVAELALCHRRSHGSDRGPDDGGSGPGGGSGQGSRPRAGTPSAASNATPAPSNSAAHSSASAATSTSSSARSSTSVSDGSSGKSSATAPDGASNTPALAAAGHRGHDGEHGALPATPVRALHVAASPSWLAPKLPTQRARSSEQPYRTRHKTAPAPSHSIDWFKTLALSPRRAKHAQPSTSDLDLAPTRASPRVAPREHTQTPDPAKPRAQLMDVAGANRLDPRAQLMDVAGANRLDPRGQPVDGAAASGCNLRGPRDFRYRLRPTTRALTVLALDCSASMLRGGALAAAKGVARALFTAPGSARTELALIAFSGARAAACIARASGPRLDRAVTQLGAGGGTPLRQALLDALALARRADKRGATSKRLLLFSDGRTSEPIADLRALRDAFDVSVIDCERTRVRLGRARAIAQGLAARYIHIDSLVPPKSL